MLFEFVLVVESLSHKHRISFIYRSIHPGPCALPFTLLTGDASCESGRGSEQNPSGVWSVYCN